MEMVGKIYKVLVLMGVFWLFLFMPQSVMAGEESGRISIIQEVEKTGQVPENLNETVFYELRGCDGAPLPEQGDIFKFQVVGDTEYILDFGKAITYKKNGLYTYRLSVQKTEKTELDIKKAEYKIDCLVKNDGTRDLYVTDLGSGEKVDQICVTPVYSGKTIIDRLSKIAETKKGMVLHPKTGDSGLEFWLGLIFMAVFGSLCVVEKKI